MGFLFGLREERSGDDGVKLKDHKLEQTGPWFTNFPV